MGCPFIEHRERVASFVAARDRAAAQPDDMGYALAKAVRLDQLKRARARADRAARNIAYGLAVVGAMRFGMEIQAAVDTVDIPEFAEELRALVRSEVAKRQKPGECR